MFKGMAEDLEGEVAPDTVAKGLSTFEKIKMIYTGNVSTVLNPFCGSLSIIMVPL